MDAIGKSVIGGAPPRRGRQKHAQRGADGGPKERMSETDLPEAKLREGMEGLRRAALARSIDNGATGGSASLLQSDTAPVEEAALPARYSGPVPVVSYVHGGGRALLYNNNPEQLTKAELADRAYGGHSIYREELAPGRYRNFFEHMNLTGMTIGYGVALTNPGATPVQVRLNGAGFEPSMNGGVPFREMLNAYHRQGAAATIPPGETMYILKEDGAIPPLAFFSGVVDFTVSGGAVVMNDLAYADRSKVADSPEYVGYVMRNQVGGTSEARMYKGMNPHTEVRADGASFTVSDGDTPGVLPVRCGAWNLASGKYTEPTTHENGWITHIGPFNNADAVSSDMFAFETPGFGRIDPFKASDGVGKYPNFGNWGPLYTLSGSVTNSGTRARTVAVSVKANPKSGAAIAYRGSDGLWRDGKLRPGESLPYYVFTVEPGETKKYAASLILGGPSGGNLVQTVSLRN